jgi:hypothetical protein
MTSDGPDMNDCATRVVTLYTYRLKTTRERVVYGVGAREVYCWDEH